MHFKPGGAFPFFRVPPAELGNQSVALECLWGSASALPAGAIAGGGDSCREVVCAGTLLVGALAKPLGTASRRQLRLTAALRFNATPPVSKVVDQVGFSQRRFIQLFRDEVGLTPKLFSRVRRFQKVIQTAHAADEINWTHMALDCGYYDQAHFIHDFQSSPASRHPSTWRERHRTLTMCRWNDRSNFYKTSPLSRVTISTRQRSSSGWPAIQLKRGANMAVKPIPDGYTP